jgi:hypothetical protein
MGFLLYHTLKLFRWIYHLYSKFPLLKVTIAYYNRDNVVGTVTRLRVEWSRVQIPAGGKRFFLCSKMSRQAPGSRPISYSPVTKGFASGSKAAGSRDWPLTSIPGPRLRMCGAVPPFTLYTCMVCTRTTLLYLWHNRPIRWSYPLCESIRVLFSIS